MARFSAVHQVDGSCSLHGGTVAGWGAWPDAEDPTGVQVVQFDRGRLGRRVDAGDEGHGTTLPLRAVAVPVSG